MFFFFFYDILVYNKSITKHVQHLELVLNLLMENRLFLKESKCSFGQTSIAYLGHIVSAEGVGPDPEKINAKFQWPQPVNVKQLR